jgi:hypothetical protein
VDHQLTSKHGLGGRYLYNDNFQGGGGQATPPGLTTQNPLRTQAASAWLTSSLTPRTLNELRVSYQRYATTTTASDPQSETIPSIEVSQLGLTGFNAASDRTAIGLAVNLPQLRGAHSLKFGADLRRTRIAQIDLSLMKTTRIRERHRFQLRADFFNFSNTRNFGIPEARINNAGFANQWGTDGGNRRIFVSAKYQF